MAGFGSAGGADTTLSWATAYESPDAVEYRIFRATPFDEADARAARAELLADARRQLTDYVWQREGFTLELARLADSDEFYLQGACRYGENVEDEWLITALLRRFTASDERDLFAQVKDRADGEFLLIEAADSLPRWLEPESSGNRVFLWDGQVCVVDAGDRRRGLPLGQAIAALRSGPGKFVAGSAIQASLQRRTEGYPERAVAAMHRACVVLPLEFAVALRERPQLLAAATAAFRFDREATSAAVLDLRRAVRKKRAKRRRGEGADEEGAPPGAEAPVATMLRFPRHIFAPLIHSAFPHGGLFMDLFAAAEALGRRQAAELGARIALGIAALRRVAAQERDRGGDGGGGGGGGGESGSEDWEMHLRALRVHGYFGEHAAGGEEHDRLLRQAKAHFDASKSLSHAAFEAAEDEELFALRREKVAQDAPRFGAWDAALEERVAEVLRGGAEVASRFQAGDDDDDSWLNVTAGDLEELFGKDATVGGGGGGGGGGTDNSGGAEAQMRRIAETMEEFLKSEGGVDGLENGAVGDVDLDVSDFIRALGGDADELSAAYDAGGWDAAGADGAGADGAQEAAERAMDVAAEGGERGAAEDGGRDAGGERGGFSAASLMRVPGGGEDAQGVSCGSAAAETLPEDLADFADAYDGTMEGELREQGMHLVDDVGKATRPVEVDMGQVRDFLLSAQAQQGGAGPVTNMLREMGFPFVPPAPPAPGDAGDA